MNRIKSKLEYYVICVCVTQLKLILNSYMSSDLSSDIAAVAKFHRLMYSLIKDRLLRLFGNFRKMSLWLKVDFLKPFCKIVPSEKIAPDDKIWKQWLSCWSSVSTDCQTFLCVTHFPCERC